MRLGVGLIATIAALVLSLLIAAAKSSFDTQSSQIKQFTADLILLDDLLGQYGPGNHPYPRTDAERGCASCRSNLARKIGTKGTFEINAKSEALLLEIQVLSPRNDVQRSLQARAVQISTSLARTRLLLFVELDSSIPTPFLAVLVLWLVIIFASFSLFADINATVFALLSLLALSASCAIFLILELSEPFADLMMISSEPLRNALAPLGW